MNKDNTQCCIRCWRVIGNETRCINDGCECHKELTHSTKTNKRILERAWVVVSSKSGAYWWKNSNPHIYGTKIEAVDVARFLSATRKTGEIIAVPCTISFSLPKSTKKQK